MVRAVIQMGGVTLATAMAADANLEAAEDRAKLRVLETLITTAPVTTAPSVASEPIYPGKAIEPAQPLLVQPLPVQPLPVPPLPTPPLTTELPMPQPTFGAAVGAVLGAEPTAMAAAMASTESERPSWEAEFQSVTQLSPLPVAEPIELEPVKAGVTSGLRTSKSERASKRSAEPAPEPAVEQPAAEPADRSEEIMRIGIEMKRLGWSTEQGREYLKRTYGKSSRSKLDDAELLDFLHYLEMQSSPLQTQTPF